jgi:hypothetical protein
MGGVVVVIFIIVMLAARRRGQPISIPFRLQLWVAKYFLLIFLLTVFSAAGVGLAWLAPVLILFFVPSLVLRLIVVPLGLPRVAYWTARCCVPLGFGREAAAGGVFYGALALARKSSPSPPAIGWLAQKAKQARLLRGGGVVAAGLLAALRGDRHRARCLFLVADALPRNFISSSARAAARDWLVVEAARIGSWHEVIRLGRRGRNSLRWSYALARIAERLTGDADGRGDLLLWLCWVAAPRRRFSLSLLRRALAVPLASERAVVAPSIAGDLPEALAGLAQVLENGLAQDSRSFARSVSEVEAALDRSATYAAVQQRLLALGAQADAAGVLAAFRTRLVDWLVPLVEEAPDLAGEKERSPILDQAIEQVRARLFKDIAAQCRDYDDRQKRESSLDAVAEWEAWAVTRNAADRLLALAPESENALFHSMYVQVCNFAVFQHNACKRTPLAHDMYSWLHRHAGSDSAALQLLSKNMRASRA